jgi:voltage-gated potassium channel
VGASSGRYPPAPRANPRRTLLSAAAALIAIVAFGTCGIMVVEGWGFLQALFFTLVTLTTVGYGDYGLSDGGKAFTVVLMVGGLAVVTYSAGLLLPPLFSHQLSWERKMSRRIEDLGDHFIVCGLGRIGRAVCQHLARAGMPFIAIDTDPDAVSLVIDAGQLGLVGDATDDDVLEQAGIRRAKGIACVTGSDTENIVITLTAREMNPDAFIVSRAEQDEVARKFHRAGATRVISPVNAGSLSVANAILKPNLTAFLERTHDRTDAFELAEVTVEPGSLLVGRTFRDKHNAHQDVALVALQRPGESTRVRPSGEEALRDGDVLIVAGDMLSIAALQRECARPLARSA